MKNPTVDQIKELTQANEAGGAVVFQFGEGGAVSLACYGETTETVRLVASLAVQVDMLIKSGVIKFPESRVGA